MKPFADLPLSIREGSVRALIDHRARTAPDAVFLIDPVSGAETSYLQVRDAAAAVAAALLERGAGRGDRIAYAFGNGTRQATALLGILYGGFVATAVNLVAGNETIAYVLDHSDARLVLADEQGARIVTDAGADTPLMTLEQALGGQAGNHVGTSDTGGGADGLLMYTSGTTGRPKGVVLTMANLIAGGANTALAHRLTDADRGLCVLPLYHINGLCVTLMGALVSGGSLVMPGKFSVSTFWQTIARTACTWFSVVPTQISYLLHHVEMAAAGTHDCRTPRFGRSASAPLSPDVQAAFERRFGVPIIETMGLTETAAQILSNPLPPGIRKIGSPGIAYGNEVRIGDQQQRDVARGEEGEVLVRGSNVMTRYLKDEDATRQALTQDGWLRTGDLGRMDEDGYVYITGRLKELIIKGGENIAPREIDEALYSHPDVVEAAAFGRRCARYGETVEAAVKLCDGSRIGETDLIALCRRRVGAFKSPERVHILAELPKGPSGKIQRARIAEVVGTPT